MLFPPENQNRRYTNAVKLIQKFRENWIKNSEKIKKNWIINEKTLKGIIVVDWEIISSIRVSLTRVLGRPPFVEHVFFFTKVSTFHYQSLKPLLFSLHVRYCPSFLSLLIWFIKFCRNLIKFVKLLILIYKMDYNFKVPIKNPFLTLNSERPFSYSKKSSTFVLLLLKCSVFFNL